MAVTPLIAEADGAQKKHRVATITSQGFYLVIILTMPLAMIIANLDRLLLAMGQDPVTIALADTYLDIMAWGCFPILGFMLLRGVASGLSHARPLMLIVMGGTISNIVGNYVLAFGKFGFPHLEIAGLAIASVITFWLMFLALVVYLIRHPRLKLPSFCSVRSISASYLPQADSAWHTDWHFYCLGVRIICCGYLSYGCIGYRDFGCSSNSTANYRDYLYDSFGHLLRYNHQSRSSFRQR
jgi:Na+-driven multidrug efflux pump